MSKLTDPFASSLMELRYKSHPWHGVSIGDGAPDRITCFIEMVSTDTVKYEVDKDSGYLCIDRPQKYSTTVPALYGFAPQTYSGDQVAGVSNRMLGRTDILGDGDPLDVCVLTEKTITHGDILVRAKPIGGIRMIDHNASDDKIICVLSGDAVYGNVEDVSQLSPLVVERLRHYFMTYKDIPGAKRNVEVTHIFGAEEARDIILAAMEDYDDRFNSLDTAFGG